MSIPLEDFVGTGGVRIAAESNADHRARKNRGATVVSQQGRGGVSNPAIKFRAFNVAADGSGMTITEPHTSAAPAPQLYSEPLENLAGMVMVPGLPPVPAPAPSPAYDPAPRPPGDNVAAPTIIIPNFPRSTDLSDNQSANPLSQIRLATESERSLTDYRQVRPTQTATFIGEFSETDFDCYEIVQDETLGFLSLVMPSSKPVRLKPNQELDIRVNGQEKHYWFTGINIPLPDLRITIRIFAESKAMQEPQPGVESQP